jgi:K+-sensing histidine kinase KdpD
VVLFIIVAIVPLLITILLAARGNEQFFNTMPPWLLVGLVVCTVAFAAAIALLTSNRLSLPVRMIMRSMRLVAKGDFTRRLSVRNCEEWTQLIQDYNEMVDGLERLKAEREESLHQISLSLRHRTDELNAVVVENTRLRAEAQQQVKSVSALHEFSRTVTTSPGVGRICGQLIEALESQLFFEVGYILLVNESTLQLVPVAILDKIKGLRLMGQYVKDLPKSQVLPGKSMAYQVIRVGAVLRSSDVDESSATRQRRHLLGVPLRTNNRTIGVMVLGVSAPRIFSKQDERIVTTLAEQTAMAIENSRLLEEAGKVETLREIDRLKSDLISTISHELRTPVASIKGYISTLLRPDVTWAEDTKEEFLQIIDEESDRLQSLIDNLLQMSRIDAGMLRIDRQQTSLPRLAQKVARKTRVRAPKHRFAVVFPNDMPDVAVDPTQIELVLGNLVNNAVKYSSAGGRITIRGEMADGEVKINISDEGIGINPQHLERIFERFYRANTPETKRISGTGLGLSICRGIVEAHGGRIFAESVPGKGSTFTFILPVLELSSSEFTMTATPAGGKRAEDGN